MDILRGQTPLSRVYIGEQLLYKYIVYPNPPRFVNKLTLGTFFGGEAPVAYKGSMSSFNVGSDMESLFGNGLVFTGNTLAQPTISTSRSTHSFEITVRNNLPELYPWNTGSATMLAFDRAAYQGFSEPYVGISYRVDYDRTFIRFGSHRSSAKEFEIPTNVGYITMTVAMTEGYDSSMGAYLSKVDFYINGERKDGGTSFGTSRPVYNAKYLLLGANLDTVTSYRAYMELMDFKYYAGKWSEADIVNNYNYMLDVPFYT